MLKAASFAAEGCKASAFRQASKEIEKMSDIDMWLANEAFKWVEFFSGSGMASKCVTQSG